MADKPQTFKKFPTENIQPPNRTYRFTNLPINWLLQREYCKKRKNTRLSHIFDKQNIQNLLKQLCFYSPPTHLYFS